MAMLIYKTMCIRIRILHSTLFFSPPFLVKETKSSWICEFKKNFFFLNHGMYISSRFPQLREISVAAKLQVPPSTQKHLIVIIFSVQILHLYYYKQVLEQLFHKCTKVSAKCQYYCKSPLAHRVLGAVVGKISLHFEEK